MFRVHGWQPRVLEVLFFCTMFFLAIQPLRDFDIWFHVKSGEVIAHEGLIRHDVFSHSAQGREWYPYEWLFQVSAYGIQRLLGLEAVKFVVAGVVTVHLFVLYTILWRIAGIGRVTAAGLCFLFFVSVYEFFSARPHVVAYTFLVTNLFLILWYVRRGRNVLWAMLPITLAWANLHGSVFLAPAFCAGYVFVSLIEYALSRDRVWLSKAGILALYTLATAILTVLPPLRTTQYRLLWLFFENRHLISHYIEEWTPLSYNPLAFRFFSISTLLVFSLVAATVVRRRAFRQAVWLLPLLPFPLLAFLASRNVFLGYVSFTLLLGWCVSQWRVRHLRPPARWALAGTLAALVAAHGWILWQKRIPERLYYPVDAAQFILDHRLQGNMFNEYGYGGYLLYNLYPRQKVFIDGRTDVYLCCEIPDTLTLSTEKRRPDAEYKEVLDALWRKYNISFVVIRTQKHSTLRKIARVLTDDPAWSLVFWDDDTQVFVRKDGNNDSVIAAFGARAATPYNKEPYRAGREEEARAEYARMLAVVDSARSRNALGFLLLKEGKKDDARREFEQAAILDKTFESPSMNLAELAAERGDTDDAITLYERARRAAPDRGLIYIRLGELTLDAKNDLAAARRIWEQGLQRTVDDDAKKTLEELLAAHPASS